ncbi:hypothetical protein [Pleionea sp. CnH1-48]|uniref:DUF7638 domain-containing protein n=1 Tax=Pleionea sp. CnH1-48 TaxID=2954494 RepID=UPI002096BC16|nr:hypothetical protein [Pleionea sp. CnH1-48]MCO7222950.1 hypothetical protein [Pleionea sp. CnH1-48]
MKFLKKFFNRFKNETEDIHLSRYSGVERIKRIAGYSVPGLLHDGSDYTFCNMDIYEDGLVDCGERVDLEGLEAGINSEKYVFEIPDHAELSFPKLGCWRIYEGRWLYNKDSYYEHLVEVLKVLNPELENLYSCHGKTSIVVDDVEIPSLGEVDGYPIIKADEDDYFSERFKGERFAAFLKRGDDEYCLTSVCVFADSSITLSLTDQLVSISIEEFLAKVTNGDIVSNIPLESKVIIFGLGEFRVSECIDCGNIQEVADELIDWVSKLNGEKTRTMRCYDAFIEYMTTPTVATREALKTRYELVPGHLRGYTTGNIEYRDIPIRIILYGEQEIELWDEYVIAKSEERELPTITVPRPVDE